MRISISAPVVLLALFALACGGGGNGGTGGGSGGSTGGGSSAGGGSAGGGSGGNTGGGVETGGGMGGGGTGGSSGGSGGGTGGGTGGTITVTGKVINSVGNAVANATVVIIAKGSTTTDAMGNFSFTNVTTPYDISTVTTSGATTYITVVKALTRNNPTLFSFATGGTPNTATITGDITGTGVAFPTPVTRETYASFESNEVNRTVSVSTLPYSIGTSWYGSTAVTGTVHAMQWVKNTTSGLPTSYIGYGSLPNVTIAAGNTAMMKNVAVSTVTTQLLSGNVTAPAMYNLGSKTLSMRFGMGAAVTLASETNMTAAFSYITPVIANTTMSIRATSVGTGSQMGRDASLTKQGLAANATGVAITLPTPPGLSLPTQNATGIALATQPFSWAPMDPAGLYIVQMVAGGNRLFAIFTSSTSFTLPSTTELGLGTLPASTNCSWSVTGYGGGVTTTDALTGVTGPIFGGLSPATGDVWTGGSESRSFTTN